MVRSDLGSIYHPKSIQERIYNGRETLFWHEKWLHDQPLIELATTEIPMVESFATVNNFWISQTLRDKLPEHILQILAMELIHNDGNDKD